MKKIIFKVRKSSRYVRSGGKKLGIAMRKLNCINFGRNLNLSYIKSFVESGIFGLRRKKKGIFE